MKIFNFCLLFLTFNTIAKSQDTLKLEKNLLWEITGKGIKSPSYLYGTIHVIGKDDFFYPAHTEEKLKKCKRLTMEMDMSKQFEMAIKAMTLAPMRDGKKLSDFLSEEDYKMVKDYFEHDVQEVSMVGFSFFEKFKPMFLSGMLYPKMMKGETVSYEMEFLEKAQKEKMIIDGLETMEFQMSVFDSVPYKDQARMLAEQVKGIKNGDESGSTEFAKMVEQYKSQDVDGMADMTAEDPDFKSMENDLLTKRNYAWIPKIIEMAKEKSTFFAVGAGHLGGQNGVIRLLRKEGYKVRAVE